MIGEIKLLKPDHGYGFITSDELDNDVFFLEHVAEDEDIQEVEIEISELETGQKVDFELAESDFWDSPRATHVEAIKYSESGLEGRIEFFNKEKGYGFISSDELDVDDDAFFHLNDLDFSEDSDLEGKKVTFEVTYLPNREYYGPKVQSMDIA